MDPIMTIGVAGILTAADRFTSSAERMVKGGGDLATEMVEQVSAKQAFNASVEVVRTGDQMAKRLLDIKA